MSPFFKPAGITAALLLFLSITSQVIAKTPYVDCEVSYAGHAHHIRLIPTNDPYSVQPVDIAERFLFKGVVLQNNASNHIALSIYLQQENRPLLLQQATYTQVRPSQNYAFTGEQKVYGGVLERELIYRCWLRSKK